MGNIGDLRLADNQLIWFVPFVNRYAGGGRVCGRSTTHVFQVEPDLDGVVMAYLAGDFAGPAIAKVLRISQSVAVAFFLAQRSVFPHDLRQSTRRSTTLHVPNMRSARGCPTAQFKQQPFGC